MNKTALFSVYDKTGVAEFAAKVSLAGYKILATGKTATLLSSEGISVTEISDFTQSPEMFGGRVKTLHPKVFGGILFRRDSERDLTDSDAFNIPPIDIVCVNLYPFSDVASKAGANLEELIENIDIGGVSLIRAAAKNYKNTFVFTSPAQYSELVNYFEVSDWESGLKFRERLALEAFKVTSNYDNLINKTLGLKFGLANDRIELKYELETTLRYGENPHQKAALYGSFSKHYDCFHGKELSYNNILDMIAGVNLSEELPANSCAIIKHNIPCGVATSDSLLMSFKNALCCDPVSAFGGIVVLKGEVDEETANELNKIFLEIIVAPSFSAEAIAILKKKRDRRLVKLLLPFSSDELQMRRIPGGILVQENDLEIQKDFENMVYKTSKQLNEEQLNDLKLAWITAKHAKSNAIVFVLSGMTIGIGSGQVSRIDSVKIAANKAKEFNLDLEGSVVASDAFFPFPDSVEVLAGFGAIGVIQPGGSVRDEEVIKAAEKLGLVMVFTGKRHFKH